MTKLTTERLETIATWREAYGNGANVMIPAEEAELMARQLLAYEQADKTTDLKTLVISEIVDFYSGFESPGEPETVDEAQRQLIGRIEKVFGLAAPVLPKQPELVDLSQQVEILNRILNWILKELPVPTQKASAMAIRLSSVIDVISDLEIPAPAQPVIPAIRKNTASPMLLNFYIAYHSWVKSGARENGMFSRNAGLCVNAYDYFQLVGVSSDSLLEEMHDDFVANGLNEKLPFNDDPEHYEKESKNAACHLNPIRVQWVESKAQPVSEPYKFNTWISVADRLPSVLRRRAKRFR